MFSLYWCEQNINNRKSIKITMFSNLRESAKDKEREKEKDGAQEQKKPSVVSVFSVRTFNVP